MKLLVVLFIFLSSCGYRGQPYSFDGPEYYEPYKEYYHKSPHRHHKHRS